MIKSLLKFFIKEKPLPKFKNRILMHEVAKWKAIISFIRHSIDAQEKILIASFFQETKDTCLKVLQHERLQFQDGSLQANLSADTLPWLGTAHELEHLLSLYQGKIEDPKYLPKQVIFIEHYPLASHEERFIDKLLSVYPALPIDFCVAIDEPLFQRFGGDRIGAMLQRFTKDEQEIFSHSMIDRAIINLQQRIQADISHEKAADSPAKWLERNLGLG